LKRVSAIFATFLAIFLFVVLPANAQTPRTQTIWTQSGEGVNVIPYVEGGRRWAFVDFESKAFSNIQYVYFNFTYDHSGPGKKGGVEGSFIPGNETVKHYNGVPYIRRALIFGACSRNVCTYEPNPKNVKLTVNTKMKSGPVDQYTRILNVPN
ncbi:MAG: hypothetical protein NUV69_04460, partial [Candidatus Curtissbacteria bacterium]|nr:hypothetical protein [Candidatus Curtissbacteria bacterium]